MRTHWIIAALLLFLLSFSGCGWSVFGLFGSDDDKEAKKDGEAEPVVAQAAATTPSPTPTPGIIDTPPALKKRMMVLPFLNRSEYGGVSLGRYIASDLKDTLSNSADFSLVGDPETEEFEIFDKDKMNYDHKAIFEIARSRGVSAVVTGVIESLHIQERGEEVGLFRTRYNTVQATVRFDLHEAATEKLLFSKTSSAEVTEEHTRFFNQRDPQYYDSSRGRGAVAKAFEKVSEQFGAQAKRITWTGRIAKIDVNRFYINAGESSGILKGQLLKVFGEGFPVTDDESGNIIGIAPGRFKGILKVVDYFGNDGAVAVVHSGAGFMEKDKVEVFSPPQQ